MSYRAEGVFRYNGSVVVLAGVILSFNVIGVLCVREWIRSRRLRLYHDCQ